MSKTLTLSIVIPAYNEENHLGSCLEAIAAQTVKPDEVIVVDNNSTDRTAEIAKSYSFVSLVQEPKQGVLYARNRGFDAAKSDLIGRIDADTLLSPRWVGIVKKQLSGGHYDAVTGPVYYYDMPASSKNYWIDHQIRLRLYRGASHVPFLFGSNSALRKSVWNRVRGKVCDKRTIHEDLDLAIHLTRENQRILYSKSLLAGTSARRYDDSFKAFSRYMRIYRYTYKTHGINSVVPRIATTFYWIGYVFFRIFRKGFNPKKPRKNPMGG